MGLKVYVSPALYDIAEKIAGSGFKVTRDPGDDVAVAVSDASSFRVLPQNIPLIVVGVKGIAEWSVRQMRPDAVLIGDAEDIPNILQKVKDLSQKEEVPRTRSGFIVSMYSNKGGTGKTTAAIALAMMLAQGNISTVLCDFDVGGSDIAEFFNIKPKKNLETLDADLTVKISKNLFVFSGVYERYNFRDTEFLKLARTIAGMYNVVVIDTPPAPWEKTYLHPVFADSDIVYAIVDQSKFSIHETETYLPRLLAMGVDLDRIRIIINRYNPKLTGKKEIEQAFRSALRKDIKSTPRVSAVIPEGWEKYVKDMYKKSIPNQEEWVKLAREVASLAGLKYEEGGRPDWMPSVFEKWRSIWTKAT